jgi:hypothetical protein
MIVGAAAAVATSNMTNRGIFIPLGAAAECEGSIPIRSDR